MPESPETGSPGRERRRWPRASLGAKVYVHGDESREREYRAEDVSVGGLLLAGAQALPPDAHLGLRVELPQGELRCEGRTVWEQFQNSGECRIGVAFAGLTGEERALLEDTVAHELRLPGWRRWRCRVLLVDGHEPRKQALAEDLRRAGYEVSCTSTPLGAISRASEGPVELLVLGRPHGAAEAADLLEYFAEADPSIGRVLIWDSSSWHEVGDAVLALAHVLLPLPWNRSDLRSLARHCPVRERVAPTRR